MSTNEKDVLTLARSGVVVLVAALGGSLWHQAPLQKLPPDLVSEWLEIHFITEHTKVVAPSFIFPSSLFS